MAIDEHLAELTQTANRADLHYNIWWIYKRERPEWVGAMNAYLGFFRASLGAHFVAMVMELYKMLDRRTDSIGLETLLEEAEKEPGFDPGVLASTRLGVDSLMPTWRKISKLRHKLFAHRDLQLDYESIMLSAAIAPDDFRDFIDKSFEVLDRLSSHRGLGTWPRDAMTARDTRAMLRVLTPSL